MKLSSLIKWALWTSWKVLKIRLPTKRIAIQEHMVHSRTTRTRAVRIKTPSTRIIWLKKRKMWAISIKAIKANQKMPLPFRDRTYNLIDFNSKWLLKSVQKLCKAIFWIQIKRNLSWMVNKWHRMRILFKLNNNIIHSNSITRRYSIHRTWIRRYSSLFHKEEHVISKHLIRTSHVMISKICIAWL